MMNVQNTLKITLSACALLCAVSYAGITHAAPIEGKRYSEEPRYGKNREAADSMGKDSAVKDASDGAVDASGEAAQGIGNLIGRAKNAIGGAVDKAGDALGSAVDTIQDAGEALKDSAGSTTSTSPTTTPTTTTSSPTTSTGSTSSNGCPTGTTSSGGSSKPLTNTEGVLEGGEDDWVGWMIDLANSNMSGTPPAEYDGDDGAVDGNIAWGFNGGIDQAWDCTGFIQQSFKRAGLADYGNVSAGAGPAGYETGTNNMLQNPKLEDPNCTGQNADNINSGQPDDCFKRGDLIFINCGQGSQEHASIYVGYDEAKGCHMIVESTNYNGMSGPQYGCAKPGWISSSNYCGSRRVPGTATGEAPPAAETATSTDSETDTASSSEECVEEPQEQTTTGELAPKTNVNLDEPAHSPDGHATCDWMTCLDGSVSGAQPAGGTGMSGESISECAMKMISQRMSGSPTGENSSQQWNNQGIPASSRGNLYR